MYIPVWVLISLLVFFAIIVLTAMGGLEDKVKKLKDRVNDLEEDMEEAKLSPDEKHRREMRKPLGPPDYPDHPLA